MSDHCVIHLLPKYRQLVKREGPKTRIIRKWDHDTAETMRGCFEGTNWDIFYENEDDLDTITDSITSYASVKKILFEQKGSKFMQILNHGSTGN